MDGNHPKDIDPRPKRRRAKDNPYEIYTVGIHTDQPHYFIAFTDYGGVHHEIEINKALFETLNRFELDDLSFPGEVDNHYKRSELTEASLSAKASVSRKPWRKSLCSIFGTSSYIEQSRSFAKSSAPD